MGKALERENRYDLKGLQICGIAFAIIALATFAVQIVRVFAGNGYIELAYLGVLIVGWVLMFIGAGKIKKYSPYFRAVHIISMPVMACIVLAACFGFINISNDMGAQAFLTFGVQFLMFVPFLGLLMAYWYSLRGAADLCVEFRRRKEEKGCRSAGWPGLIILIIAIFAVQGAPVAQELVKYIITASAALIALIMQMVMIHHLLVVFDVVDGKKPSERLGDILTDTEKDKFAMNRKKDRAEQMDGASDPPNKGTGKKFDKSNIKNKVADSDNYNKSSEYPDLEPTEQIDRTDDVVEEDWLRKEFDEIALVGKDEATFEEFKDTIKFPE